MDVSFDTLNAQEEQVLLELSYFNVVTKSFEKALKSVNHFYTAITILSAFTIQRLYEKNVNTGAENWLLISLTPSKIGDDTYKIQWPSGYHCCQATYH